MAILTASERAGMIRDSQVGLHETATIRRKASDGTWSDVATGVACRIDATSSQQGEQPGVAAPAGDVEAQVSVSLPYGTDVRRHDAIVVGTTRVEVVRLVPGGLALLRVLGTVRS